MQVSAQQRPGALVVEGIVRANCDRPLPAVVRVQALNAQGQTIASGSADLGVVAIGARPPFSVALADVQAARVIAVAQLP